MTEVYGLAVILVICVMGEVTEIELRVAQGSYPKACTTPLAVLNLRQCYSSDIVTLG